MRKISWKLISGMCALALAFVVIPCGLAQCGLSIKPVKPMAWQPLYGGAQAKAVLAALDEGSGGHEASIVGMWHVIFTAQTMNGAPFSGVIDNALSVWHRDGSEIMNSARPAQDGNFCLGVWEQTGRFTYFLNHIPWMGNDTTNAPGGIGNPTGGVQLLEKVALRPDGNSFTGVFKLDSYDTTGNLVVSFTGVLKAKRVTINTAFKDLLNDN